MTQRSDGVETIKAVVVTLDICSSSIIIEDLLKSERFRIWRDLIISIKAHLWHLARTHNADLHKFIGDGWIMLFNQPYSGRSILNVLDSASEFYRKMYEHEILPNLETLPKPSGLTFGIAEGRLIKVKMQKHWEYIGRPINIACRLQGSISEYDIDSGFRALISHGAFHKMKHELTSYHHNLTEKSLKNLGDGKPFPCYQILLDDGFKIVDARYGSKENDVDVKFQYAKQIRNDRLHVKVSNQIAEIDPDRGKPKTLKIKFSLKGDIQEREFAEGSWVDLP
jgi:class 3 adenylate cyclase